MSAFFLAAWLLTTASPLTAELRVEVLGLHSEKGEVGCILFGSKDGFPTKPGLAVRKGFVSIQAGPRATCVFSGLAPGDYAAAIYHDENGNHRLDTKLFGIPAEGVAVTRDAPAHFGPPRFEDARVQVPAAGLTVQAHVKY